MARTGQHDAANWTWRVLSEDKAHARTTEHAMLAVLMDIRTELSAITSRLDCYETLSIPRWLKRISANTHKPKKRKRAAR